MLSNNLSANRQLLVHCQHRFRVPKFSVNSPLALGEVSLFPHEIKSLSTGERLNCLRGCIREGPRQEILCRKKIFIIHHISEGNSRAISFQTSREDVDCRLWATNDNFVADTAPRDNTHGRLAEKATKLHISTVRKRMSSYLVSKLGTTGFLLQPTKPIVQHRLFVTKSDGDFTTKELNSSDKISNKNCLYTKDLDVSHSFSNIIGSKTSNENVSSTPDSPKVISECKHIKVDHDKEVSHVLQKFPTPKTILHNFYQILAVELKDDVLKTQPIFRSVHLKNGAVAWACSYHIKWPINAKITAQQLTKKKASSIAAAKIIDILLKQKKISETGTPLIYTKEDVKKLKLQKQAQLQLDNSTVKSMHNIIKIFNDEMLPVIESVDLNITKNPSTNEFISKEYGPIISQAPQFLGAEKYLAKEKIPLPISEYKDLFIELLKNNRCIIVKGEPGCGKSSRVPQYVLESWIRNASSEDDFCRIVVTQPRRIAAISLAGRVAFERNETLGHVVGYQVRLKSKFQLDTGRILYCTTGILLRHLQTDQNLSKFSHIILDEAHERDVNTDLLLNLLKRAIQENDSLKLIVMSATIDSEAFSGYFNGAPVFSVPGFTFPVKKYFLDQLNLNCSKTLSMCQSDMPQVIHEDVVEVINFIHRNKPEGAILVFLSGWEDFVKVGRLINARNDMVVYKVHSKLKDSEQHEIFSRPPPGVRKVILATNIAETSITIDDVVYVIDTGIHKDKIFDIYRGINVIDMEWISKASANQRAGRAGRCSPGESYHLYSLDRYNKLPDYSSPKILNSSLTKVVLDSKVFTNNMGACDFMNSLITPPETAAVEKAVDELKQLELLDENEKLTPLGRTLANFQLEPSLAKAMVNGVVYKCVTPVVDIVTLFSSETEIFGSLSLTDKEFVKKVKSQYCRSSDHIALMRIYEKWLELEEEEGTNVAKRFCASANLVPYKLQFTRQLKEIHLGYLYNGLQKCMPLSDQFSDNEEMVKAVLYSGTGTILEHRNWDLVKNRLKTNVNVLVTRNNHKATITSESVNYKRYKFPSNFLVYINETRSNVRRTTIVRECSLIPPISVLLFTNRELELIESNSSESTNDNMVIIGIKNTKLQVLCDKELADLLVSCKKVIDSSYKYLIHQLTCAGEDNPNFSRKWDEVLRHLDAILNKNKID